MGGQVDFMFGTLAASNPLVTSGKLRALAITSPKRSPLLPDVPTVAESVLPGYEAYEWNGLLLPAGTPDAVVQKLHKAVADSLQEEEVKKRFADMGAQPVGNTPAEFADFLQKESDKWSAVIRKGNIKVD
jgi:tripartite-type tricarboxylate transporter receptor subunit TctC